MKNVIFCFNFCRFGYFSSVLCDDSMLMFFISCRPTLHSFDESEDDSRSHCSDAESDTKKSKTGLFTSFLSLSAAVDFYVMIPIELAHFTERIAVRKNTGFVEMIRLGAI